MIGLGLEKNKYISKIIPILWLIHIFFLARRGGESKDKTALLLMAAVLFYSILQKYYKKYIDYRYTIITGLIYMFFIAISYYFSDIKSNDRFYTFTHATLYSIGFFFLILNYKLEKKIPFLYYSYINIS